MYMCLKQNRRENTTVSQTRNQGRPSRKDLLIPRASLMTQSKVVDQ